MSFISRARDALTLVEAFAQLLEYASQDGDPKVFEPLRKPINDRAADFRRTLGRGRAEAPRRLARIRRSSLPTPVDVGLEAAPASRLLPIQLRDSGNPARRGFPPDPGPGPRGAGVPQYRAEKPGPGSGQGPVTDLELADQSLELFPLVIDCPTRSCATLAGSGRLADPEVRSRLRPGGCSVDGKARRLATEFACQWLHIADFDQLDEKSERHFPTFLGLRGCDV